MACFPSQSNNTLPSVAVHFTPWQRFMEVLDEYVQARSISSPYTSLTFESNIFKPPGMMVPMGPEPGRFSLRSSINNSSRSDPSSDYLGLKTIPHQSFFHQAPFLPRSITNQPHRTNDLEFDLLGGNTYLTTMKLFVLVVSNNFGRSQMDSLFDWLSRDHTARSILSRLLRQNLVSMKVCAEKLIVPAVRHRDRSTLTLLISLGVDLNTRQYRIGGDRAAIHCAVEYQYPEIVDLLLENGANDWCVPVYDFEGTRNLVDLAVLKGDVMLLEKLLECELRVVGSHQSASVGNLELAISQNRWDLVRMIVRHRPEIWVPARKKPWLLFEAAALWEDTTMMDALHQEGLDVKASDGKYGSPLAVASAMGHTELVQYLLAADVNLENVNTEQSTPAFRQHPRTALQQAVEKGHIEIIHLLSEYGANLNGHRRPSLLQLAAHSGNLETVKMLLEFGAKIDAPRKRPVSDDIDDNDDEDNDVPAIHIALSKGRLDIVKALSDAGARFASLRTDRIGHNCSFQPYNCPVFHNDVKDEAGETRSDDLKNSAKISFYKWWDP
jgi:ankyrin repeat protein